MLIRKSLHGNLHPNPGDLYDPRDGTCLPNFHLSTTHNPNLAHIVQEMVRYDIQLVPEAPTSVQRRNASSHGQKNLTLLAVAEYSERIDVIKQRIFPFTVHKVFYREAIAGVLMLRRAISDKETSLLQNVLTNCIPNPENLEGTLFERCVRPISKISIIQHGQEYHYTNIKMAFVEISKIVNFVCSPDNLNARSVLVDIPSVIDYTLLDENKHLAYIHEQGRKRRQEEAELREKNQHRNRFDNTYSSLETKHTQHNRSTSHQVSQSNYDNTWHREHKYDSSIQQHGLQQQHNSQTHHHTSDNSCYYMKFPVETKIQTENGKKIVTYNHTGQQIIYNEEDLIRGFGYGVVLEDFDYKSKKTMSKSLTNLASVQDIETKEQSTNSQQQFPPISYLKSRSHSLEDILDKDKIDRYPSLLIQPGRRKQKSALPEHSTNIKNLSYESASSDGKTVVTPGNMDSKHRHSFHGEKSLTRYDTKNLGEKDAKSKAAISARNSVPSVQRVAGVNKTTMLHPSVAMHRREDDDSVSVVSAFSDISVSTQLRDKAEEDFEDYFRDQQRKGNGTYSRHHQIPSHGRRGGSQHYLHQNVNAGGSQQKLLVQRQHKEATDVLQEHRVVHQEHYYNEGNYRPQVMTEPEDYASDSNSRKNYVKPVGLHPTHLKAAEDFLSKHYDSYYAVSSSCSNASDSSPAYSKASHNDSALTLDSSPSSPTLAGGDTVDRNFIYRAFPANVR